MSLPPESTGFHKVDPDPVAVDAEVAYQPTSRTTDGVPVIASRPCGVAIQGPPAPHLRPLDRHVAPLLAMTDEGLASDLTLRIVLSDGRELSAPLAWFPRLRDATPAQRRNWEPIGRGHGLHWPDVDEDISVRALMGLPT